MARAEEKRRNNPSPEDGSVGSIDQETYECSICKDVGFTFEEREHRIHHPGGDVVWRNDVAIACACREKKRIERLFKSSHITDAFQKLGFQNFVTEGRPQCVGGARDSAIHYLKNFEELRNERRNSVALLGPPGSGKTHLLMAISNNLMRKGIGVLYFPYVEGFNDLRVDMDAVEEKVDAMKRVDVLYIDDLFKGRKSPTEWMIEQLFAVVNYRYLNHLPILLSSERDVDAVCEVEEAIGSRLYEMSKEHTVVMGLTDEEATSGVKLNYRLREE